MSAAHSAFTRTLTGGHTTADEAAKRAVDELKRAAATWAVSQLKDEMIVGLGSRSTAAFAVSAIGKLVKEGLRITGIPTSEETFQLARSFGIPLSTLAGHPEIDVTIDGADEVELDSLNLIKGGGGNLLREKIVALGSNQLMIIVDQNKLVTRLGSRAPVPVEVVQFGWESTGKRLAALGSTPILRNAADQKAFITDNGNYIFDCTFGPIRSAQTLQAQLDATVGVVEHGMFVGMTSRVVVGQADSVWLLESMQGQPES
jgi:ribose 5-phosphate isomerase A